MAEQALTMMAFRGVAPCPDENVLVRVVQREATPAELAGVRSHANVCTACAALLAHLEHVSGTLNVAQGAERPEATVAAAPKAMGRERALAAGARFGRYELAERIGAGGMGAVHAAQDPVLERRIALKLIEVPEADRGAAGRLLREARAMARVESPFVVAVHDAGAVGDFVFVAMELVRGPSLRRLLPELSPEEILVLFVDAGRGLAAAHAASVVHRDFKPENVLVTSDEPRRAKVTDFGLARPAGADDEPPRSIGAVAWTLEDVTRNTLVRGTPAYMSPEQLDGKELDPRTDQYSFAVALYEALYKRRPFARASIGEMRAAMRDELGPCPPEPTTPQGSKKPADAPAWVWPILVRALREDRSARFESMNELVEELAQGEAKSADVHLGVHALALGAMFFLHVLLLAMIPLSMLAGDDGPATGPQWVYDVVGAWLGVLLASGWAPLGLGLTAACAYGLLHRRRWAYVATMIYAVTALLSVVGAPYAIFAFWSLRRPAVRAALGRSARLRG
jgi:hypothetical protein